MKTRPFQIPRLRLAYLASEEYLRSLWWIAGTIPAFGVVLLIFGRDALQIIGLMAILWPISIPARAIVSSSKASNLFTGGCYAVLDDDSLVFYDTTQREKPLRWRLPLIRVRDVIERHEFYLVRMRKLGFVAIPFEAFESDDDKARFARIIAHAIETRYASM